MLRGKFDKNFFITMDSVLRLGMTVVKKAQVSRIEKMDEKSSTEDFI
jgi:hypothetical protein